MRAGKLDATIAIQRVGSVIDDAGTPQESVFTIATLRAQVIRSSVEEFIRGYGASDETVTVFRIRYIEGVQNADKVLHGGKIHNIKEVKEIGRRRGLEIRTVSLG
jgi:head-tail adaptor